jgi:crotonobetainyl-CoA:carnitine CoA-transferase CaiB-like acyl-CoA transferase
MLGVLDGVRVIDLGDESAALAGKILGDLGADVLKVEPPGGDRRARRGPYLGGVEDPECSLAWLALHTSKRGVTLDVEVEPGRELFRRLVGTSDVVLESGPPGRLDALGVGFEALRRRSPGLVWCSVTPFGSHGPRAHWRGGDLVAVAMGGNASVTGDPDRPPVRCTLPTAYYHAAPEAALGILMALLAREDSGRGQRVDVSLQECQLQTLLSGAAQHPLHGRVPRRSGARLGRTREIWQAADGWVTFGLRGGRARIRNLIATVEWMDECGQAEPWLRDYDWASFRHQDLSAAEIERFEAAFAAFFRSRSMRDLYGEALRRRILLAPCNDAREIVEHEQLRDRELFVTLEYPELGASIEHPDFFARMEPRPMHVRRPAPRIGEHNAELYAELGLDAAAQARLAAEGAV